MGADLFDPHRPIPTLSLWEPWGSLLLAGYKWHETRHWATKVRGRIALHAAKKLVNDVDPELDALCSFAFGGDWRERLKPTLGCILGVADLVACYHSLALTDPRAHVLIDPPPVCDLIAGNFEPGRFGFRLTGVRMLAEPLPTKGRQGFFHWSPPADLEDRLLKPVDQAGAAKRWDAARYVERPHG